MEWDNRKLKLPDFPCRDGRSQLKQNQVLEIAYVIILSCYGNNNLKSNYNFDQYTQAYNKIWKYVL